MAQCPSSERSGHSLTTGPSARSAKSLWLRLVLAVVTLGVVVALSGVGYELALPSVANAPARVAAIVRAHNGVIGPLPVPARLGAAVVAVEDEHFYSNVFLNVFDGAARAALASLGMRALTRVGAPSPSNWPSSSTPRRATSGPLWNRSDWASSLP